MTKRRFVLTAVAAVTVIGLVAFRWLDRGAERSVALISPPSADAAATWVAAGASANNAGIAPAPASAAPVQSVPPSLSAPAILVRLRAPASAGLGDVFDVVIHLEAHRQVGRIAVALEYDSSLLGLIETTEGNFVERAGSQGGLSVEEPSDGRVAMDLRVDEGAPVERSGSIAVMRFEALRRGPARISVSSIDTFDTADNPMPAAVSAGQSQIAVQ